MPPTHLSLFTGIGGIDLAAEWAGFRTVAMCERDLFCRKVLARHWPDVPIVEDVHDFDGRPYVGGIDLLSGGFPCQPFSNAGLRRGVDDHRHLWPEMLRIIREARPTWVVGENAPNLVNLALDLVVADLEASGYEVEPFVFPAGGLAAPHLRQRCFLLAYAPGARRDQGVRPPDQPLRDEAWRSEPQRFGGLRLGPEHWAVEPGVARVADGFPGWVDRNRALGNAVAPQQAYPILREIHRLIVGGN